MTLSPWPIFWWPACSNEAPPPRATLLVDGKPIALNGFVEQFLARSITGMTSTLKGCDQAKEITITIRPDHANR